jgi:hypothetical protein
MEGMERLYYSAQKFLRVDTLSQDIETLAVGQPVREAAVFSGRTTEVASSELSKAAAWVLGNTTAGLRRAIDGWYEEHAFWFHGSVPPLDEGDSPRMTEEGSHWLANAALLQTCLVALGATDSAGSVEKAFGYAQSAAQTVSCCRLLLKGDASKGAALAISGLALGIAGLGIFRGPGASSSHQSMVMAMMAEVIAELEQHFREVSAQLETVLGATQAALQDLHPWKATTLEPGQPLAEIARCTDRSLRNVHTLAFHLNDESDRDRHKKYLTYRRLDVRRRHSDFECRGFYWAMGAGPKANEYLTPVGDVFESRKALRKAFNMASGKPTDPWRQLQVLAFVLQHDYGITVPGSPSYEPALRMALESASDLGSSFSDVPLTDAMRQVTALRSALHSHEAFMRRLRGAEEDPALRDGSSPQAYPVTGGILRAYRVALRQFRSAWNSAMDAAVERCFAAPALDAGERFAQDGYIVPRTRADVEKNSWPAQILVAKAIVEDKLHPLRECASTLEQAGDALRAVCHLAHEAMFIAADDLQKKLNGCDATRLVDLALLDGWATTVLQLQLDSRPLVHSHPLTLKASPSTILQTVFPTCTRDREEETGVEILPGTFMSVRLPPWDKNTPHNEPVVNLADIAEARFKGLDVLVLAFLKEGSMAGQSFGLARAARMFVSTFPDGWADSRNAAA